MSIALTSNRGEKWEAFREQILDLDGFACRRCGKRQADGAVLQVHHTIYFPGRMPWDYPPSSCETLCKGCHAEQHGIIKPQTGWELLGWDDAGDLCEHCENCGTEIRVDIHEISPSQFRIHMNWRAGKRGFETLVDAKKAAFAAISDGSVVRYFAKHPTQ